MMNDIKKLAEELLTSSGITFLPVDVNKIALDVKCEIFYMTPEQLPDDFKCKKDNFFNGAIIKKINEEKINEETYYLIVNPRHLITRQRFTIAHEIGHVYLKHVDIIDCREDIYTGDKNEQDANDFAGNLLMPENWFLHMYKSVSVSESRLANIFLVSEQAIKMRKKALGL